MKPSKDPVCGMMVSQDGAASFSHQGQEYYFCSEFCRRNFQDDPARYAAQAQGRPSPGLDPSRRIAYFSMEVAVDSAMPNYSGGLGVLAGDTLKSCADLRIPVVGVSLLYKNGYFRQHLDAGGNQQESAVVWEPSSFCRLLPATTTVSIESRTVRLRVWQYDIEGATGYTVPLFLLDTDVEENASGDRELTAWLYGGDQRYRVAQEVLLGVGGVRALRSLGFAELERFHMNEGHAALLALELLREHAADGHTGYSFDKVRARCVFTTHTPVPAGQDQFPYDLFTRVAGELLPTEVTRMLGGEDRLNMTLLGLNTSHYVNGVAKRHGEVSRAMFAGYPIESVTNGVHSRTWTCESFRELYDRHMPGWANDPFSLRYAIGIPRDEIWAAHARAKAYLIDEVGRRTGVALAQETLTIGFARRAAQYKRADLLFRDLERLVEIAKTAGPLQILFAGKAHPKDDGGKVLIREVCAIAQRLPPEVRVAYLEDYDMALGLLLTSGADLWLNTPLRPLEASGTSGMKAAHNGVPSWSVLDGWWLEGHIEGVTGWSIGPGDAEVREPAAADEQDAEDLYRKLGAEIAPAFYGNRQQWIDIMRQTIALNASFFNTHRMVQQYVTNAYV